jgi:2-polyprenyl-6-methoxyphenol hydroxylase-like FAD-dependent oxidoreductase
MAFVLRGAMMDRTRVLIVGAGPTGLTLAAELASAGVTCAVVERRAARTASSRAFGLLPRTLELLDQRGAAERFVDEGLPWALAPVGDLKHSLDYGRLDTSFPFMLILPQHRTERILEEWAIKSGADVRRGTRVTALHQDAEQVRVSVEGPDGPDTIQAGYLVGCDGTRSMVRAATGIGFPGRAYPESLVIADVRLDRPPDPAVHARMVARGMVAVFPFGDGVYRLIVLDRLRMHAPVSREVTLDELREGTQAILGTDLGLRELVWTSRFRSEQRQATRYRSGRVLLAGDAAHSHIPSGGQGLQVGIQDAMNLGWKLAAHVLGHAPEGLLDSYERERRPVAAATLRKTDLAFRFETARSPGFRLLRRLGVALAAIGPLQVPLLEQFAGFSVRYHGSAKGSHRLVGRRLPDLRIRQSDGRVVRLYELLRARRFVLLDQTPGARYAAPGHPGVVPAAGWVLDGRRLPDAVLVRPDGYVAWTSADRPAAGLAEALRAWCGDPARSQTV